MTKVRTTHIGSLPEPAGFNADGSASDAELRTAVAWVVDKQRTIGLDVINEGELTKGGDWGFRISIRASRVSSSVRPPRASR